MSSSKFESILVSHAGSLSVSEDSQQRYCLEGRVGPATLRAWGGKMKKPTIPVAWVQVGKAYVSFHLIGVDGDLQAHRDMSKALRARMQGKTCFNFKGVDEALFQELETLTGRACQGVRKAGFIE